MTLIVVCGLQAEAAIVAGPDVRCVIGGGRSDLLRERLEAALAQSRPVGVLSFGVAGALALDLRSGELRVARAVVQAGRSYEADPPWREALTLRLKAGEAVFAASDSVATDRRAKAALRAETGADLVDMESGIAAEVALAHGLHFAAIRAISDNAGAALPRSAIVGMGPDGKVRTGAVIASALRRPQDLPALIRTAHDAGRAFKALREARLRLAAGLGPPA